MTELNLGDVATEGFLEASSLKLPSVIAAINGAPEPPLSASSSTRRKLVTALSPMTLETRAIDFGYVCQNIIYYLAEAKVESCAEKVQTVEASESSQTG